MIWEYSSKYLIHPDYARDQLRQQGSLLESAGFSDHGGCKIEFKIIRCNPAALLRPAIPICDD